MPTDFYPKGALKGREKFEAILERRYKKPSKVYLVSKDTSGGMNVYRLFIDSQTRILNDPDRWHISNSNDRGILSLIIEENNNHITSYTSGGFVFDNYWHVYSYTLHLQQSGFTVDWRFPVAVG